MKNSNKQSVQPACRSWWGCKVELECYKTLWGCTSSAAESTFVAKSQGYDGVEASIPHNVEEIEKFTSSLKHHGLKYIAEIATTGSYVPDRRCNVEAHLNDLKKNLDSLSDLKPEFVTCLGGCDAWSLEQSVEFFTRAMSIAAENHLAISFETHRGRSLFSPWATAAIVKEIPEIKLTFDISHWWVVCEGLQSTEESLIASLADNAYHIHARVGYDQGPQVPDPEKGEYRTMLRSHLNTWRVLWAGIQKTRSITSVTPEFGPDGYEYRSIDGAKSLVDLDKINQFMATVVRDEFRQWSSENSGMAR